jgi:hypothetical protein
LSTPTQGSAVLAALAAATQQQTHPETRQFLPASSSVQSLMAGQQRQSPGMLNMTTYGTAPGVRGGPQAHDQFGGGIVDGKPHGLAGGSVSNVTIPPAFPPHRHPSSALIAAPGTRGAPQGSVPQPDASPLASITQPDASVATGYSTRMAPSSAASLSQGMLANLTMRAPGE